jgi:hypothetical protein
MRDMLTMTPDDNGKLPVYIDDTGEVRLVPTRKPAQDEWVFIAAFGEDLDMPDLPGYKLSCGAYGWSASKSTGGTNA